MKNTSSEQKGVRLVLCVVDCPPVKPNDQPLFWEVDRLTILIGQIFQNMGPHLGVLYTLRNLF